MGNIGADNFGRGCVGNNNIGARVALARSCTAACKQLFPPHPSTCLPRPFYPPDRPMLSAVPDLPSLKGSTTMGTTMLVWAIMAAATSALRSSATTCARRPCAPLKAPLCWRAALRALSRCHPSRCARCRACRRPRSAKCAPNARHPSQAPLLRCQAPPLRCVLPACRLPSPGHIKWCSRTSACCTEGEGGK